MSVIQQSPAGPLQAPRVPAVPAVILDVSWQTYERILQEHGNRRLRHTYDRGQLELMTISFEHGRFRYLLGLLIAVLVEELDLPCKGGDPVTFRREDRQRGLEPDKCFYFQNAPRITGRKEIDLTRDPPPDLALEIDISTSSLNRMAVYASLGVPEVWRFDGTALRAYRLAENGQYEPCDRSSAVPSLPVGELLSFLQRGLTEGGAVLMRSFRAWVRQNLLPVQQGGPPSA